MPNFQTADIALQSGEYQRAIDLADTALQKNGDSCRGLTILALATYHERGEVQVALQLLQRASRLEPQNLLPLFNYGIISLQAGLLDQAIQAFQDFITKKTDTPEVYFNLGNAQFQKRLYTEAHRSFTEATRQNESYVDAYNNLGLTCKQLQHYPEAIQALNHAIRLGAGTNTLFNLGLTHQLSGEIQQAIVLYQQALQLNPTYEDCWYNLGICYTRLDYAEQAITCFQKAHGCNPQEPRYLNNLGLALIKLDRHQEAVDILMQALEIKADFGEALTNLGLCLEKLGHNKQAEEAYQKTVQQNPELSKGHYNLANFLKKQNRTQEAIESYQEAIAKQPNFVDAHLNLSHCLLTLGKYKEGFSEYLWRFQEPERKEKKNDLLPEWQGENIHNQTLLIYTEQGFGDTIQFCRYISLFKDMVKSIYLVCETSLVDLLQGIDGVTKVVAKDDLQHIIRQCDYEVPLLNLALFYHQKHPHVPPPVSLQNHLSHSAHFQTKIPTAENLKIGLNWQGNPANSNDHNRSCPFHFMEFLSRQWPKHHFFSLQKDLTPEIHLSENITDLTHHFTSFKDTAAVLMHLDLVITVDTAVAHLAGTLGKETWLLLPIVPDWRWMLKVTESVWYPKLKIFRQLSPHGWQHVFDRVAEELSKR